MSDSKDRDGISSEFFPLTAKRQRKYEFRLDGEERINGHDTYAIGCILAGCESFLVRGTRCYAGEGDVATVNPQEVHDGEALDDGYSYRMTYPSVALMRRKLFEQMDVVARGGEPMGVIRDPENNRCVPLPIIDRERWVKGYPRAKMFTEIQKTPGPVLPEGFVFQAGQPEDVRLAFRKAMGLD